MRPSPLAYHGGIQRHLHASSVCFPHCSPCRCSPSSFFVPKLRLHRLSPPRSLSAAAAATMLPYTQKTRAIRLCVARSVQTTSPKNNQTSKDQGTRTEDEVDLVPVSRGDRGDGSPHDTSALSAGTRWEGANSKSSSRVRDFLIIISPPLLSPKTHQRALWKRCESLGRTRDRQ